MRPSRIAVVGGGLAGIAAALDCSRAGAEVSLLEARGRLGGAAYSFTRDGLQVDNGQHVFLRCCSAYLELLEQLQAGDMVTLQPRLRIPVLAPGERRAVLRRSGLPAPLHLARSLAGYPLLRMRERIAVAWAMNALRRVDFEDPALDSLSFGQWLSDHRQSADALATVWELIARPTLNLAPADASLAQAAQVFQIGVLRHRSAADVGYARVPLSEIHDVAARRALTDAGVAVHLRHGATAVTALGGRFRIELSGAAAMEAEAVIVAVPPDRATRLLPPGSGIDRDKLAGLGSSPIVNLHVVYDRQVLDVPFAAGVLSPVQWIFDRTATSGLKRGQYLAVSLSAAEEELSMSVEELRARYVPALAELLGPDAQVEHFFVTREHAATFRAAPGARSLRPGPRTALPGLVLAGNWTDTGWPGTMEGAVRSGHAAARQILAMSVSPDAAAAGQAGRPVDVEAAIAAGGAS